MSLSQTVASESVVLNTRRPPWRPTLKEGLLYCVCSNLHLIIGVTDALKLANSGNLDNAMLNFLSCSKGSMGT